MTNKDNICKNCRFYPNGTFCKTAMHYVTINTPAQNCAHFLLPQEQYDAISFNDVWEFPLKLDDYSYSYVFSKNGVMALTFKDTFSEEDFLKLKNQATEIIDCLNGKTKCSTSGQWTNQMCDFYLNKEYIFCVRGWGHLIGTGAMNLPVEVAERIQDEFINYILETLNS